MNVAKLTYRILGQRIVTWYDGKLFVDWAVSLLKEGYESESLLILAGLDNESLDVCENYFQKALEELAIDVEINESDLIDYYVESVVQEVVTGKMQAEKGRQIMYDVTLKPGYIERYMQFCLLQDDLDSLEYLKTGTSIKGLSRDTVDEYIVKEFRIYQRLKLFDYSEYYTKSICHDCGEIMTAKWLTRYQFKKPFTYQQSYCECCDSKNIDSFFSQEGREKISAKLEQSVAIS